MSKGKKKQPKPEPPKHEQVEKERPVHIPFHLKQAAMQPSRSYLKKEKQT
jgi:hypothetical protein